MALIKEQKISQVALTVTASSAYAAKDCVGGLITFSSAFPAYARSGKLSSVTIADKADQAVEYDLLLFKSLPAGTFTNKSAVDPNDSDLLLMMPVVNLATTDHFSFNDNGVSSVSGLNAPVFSSTTDSTTGMGVLYGALVTRGTPTYASTSDLTITITIDIF